MKHAKHHAMYKHYFNHANIVYGSTIVAHIALFPLFISINAPYIIPVLSLAFISSLVALYLNIKEHFGLAAFIYLFFLVIHTTVEVIVFGLAPGFHYYYFNIATLIVFTPWKQSYKLLGVLLQIVLFITVLVNVRGTVPLHALSPELILFFQIINIAFNIIGVSNSANYYINIASDAQEKLSEQASTDALTQLTNRMGLWHFIHDVLPTFETPNIGTLLIDIDHFKSINDSYGHQCGDAILKEIALIIKSHTASSGLAVRYGGEEFLVLDAIDSPFALQTLAESMRKAIESTPFIFSGTSVPVTVSIGALYSTTQKVNFDSLFSHVDALLYQAKNDGRNRVTISTYIEDSL